MYSLSCDAELMRFFDIQRVGKGKFPENVLFWGSMNTERPELTKAMMKELFDLKFTV